jgi:hypothetical protein
MGEIFSGALQVVGWLGKEDQESRKVMHSLRKIIHITCSIYNGGFNDVRRERDRVASAILEILDTDLDAWDGILMSILQFLQ